MIKCTCRKNIQQGIHALGIKKIGKPDVPQTTHTHTVVLDPSTTTIYPVGTSTLVLAPTGRLTVQSPDVDSNGNIYFRYVRTVTEDETLDATVHSDAMSCDEDYAYYTDDGYCKISFLETYAFVATSDTAPSGRRLYTLNSPTNHVRVIGTDLLDQIAAGSQGCVQGSLFNESPSWVGASGTTSNKTEPTVKWDIFLSDPYGAVPLDPYVKGADGAYIKLAAAVNNNSIVLTTATAPCPALQPVFVTYGPVQA